MASFSALLGMSSFLFLFPQKKVSQNKQITTTKRKVDMLWNKDSKDSK